jgi:hypothetical protein
MDTAIQYFFHLFADPKIVVASTALTQVSTPLGQNFLAS